jgi:hypothetical protein
MCVCLITANPETLLYAIHFDDFHDRLVPTAITARLSIQLTETAEGFIFISDSTNIYCLQYGRACWCRGNVVHAHTTPFSGIQDSKAGVDIRLHLDDSGCESLLQKTLTQPPFKCVQGFSAGGKAAGTRSLYLLHRLKFLLCLSSISRPIRRYR